MQVLLKILYCYIHYNLGIWTIAPGQSWGLGQGQDQFQSWGATRQLPSMKIAPPLVRVRVYVRVSFGLGVIFLRGQLSQNRYHQSADHALGHIHRMHSCILFQFIYMIHIIYIYKTELSHSHKSKTTQIIFIYFYNSHNFHFHRLFIYFDYKVDGCGGICIVVRGICQCDQRTTTSSYV